MTEILNVTRDGVLSRSVTWDPRLQAWHYGSIGAVSLRGEGQFPVDAVSLNFRSPGPGVESDGEAQRRIEEAHEMLGFEEPVGGYIPLSQLPPQRKVKVTVIIEEFDPEEQS